MAEGLAHIENASSLKPALVSIEDGWQIGYLVKIALFSSKAASQATMV
jgi:hypothetical protein